MDVLNKLLRMNLKLHFIFAFILRFILLVIGYIQDAFFDLKYTDVDYHVFTDAAKYVWEGSSPYKRHTYRYTPILSYLLLPNVLINNACGKILFCTLDIFTSILIYNIQKKIGFMSNICKLCTFLWLYNPLPLVISTRGNADSIMTFLIMLLIYFHLFKRSFLSGVIYGLSIHLKIYPCIYAVSLYFTLASIDTTSCFWKKLKTLLYPNWERLVFVFSSLFGFAVPTLISFVLYKDDYVKEALLYHLIRKDIRHNFSPYFYLLYLSELMDPMPSAILSFFVFILQALLIALVTWVFVSPSMLPAGMFLQTFIFVTFNKVCTSQYFLWYMCLFPLCYPLLQTNVKNLLLAFAVWILGQVLWLLPAYYLEFQGINTFLYLCIASLFFFLINVFLICLFMKCICIVHLKWIKNK